MSQFKHREETLNSTKWAQSSKTTWLLRRDDDGEIIASCDTFDMPAALSTGGATDPIDLFVGSSVFVNEELRGAGIGRVLMEELLKKLKLSTYPFALAVFSDVGEAGLYKHVGMRALTTEKDQKSVPVAVDVVAKIFGPPTDDGLSEAIMPDSALPSSAPLQAEIVNRDGLLPLWVKLFEKQKERVRLISPSLHLASERRRLWSMLSPEQLEWHLTFLQLENAAFPDLYPSRFLESSGILLWRAGDEQLQSKKDREPQAGICWTVEEGSSWLILSLSARTRDEAVQLLAECFLEAARCGLSQVRCWQTLVPLFRDDATATATATSADATIDPFSMVSLVAVEALFEDARQRLLAAMPSSSSSSSPYSPLDLSVELQPREGALPMVTLIDRRGDTATATAADDDAVALPIDGWHNLFRGTWN